MYFSWQVKHSEIKALKQIRQLQDLELYQVNNFLTNLGNGMLNIKASRWKITSYKHGINVI